MWANITWAQWQKTSYPMKVLPNRARYRIPHCIYDNYFFLSPGTSSTLYRSSDYGFTWQDISFNKKGFVQSIFHTGNFVIGSFSKGASYGGPDTITGVYRSSDNGDTWERIRDSSFRGCLFLFDDGNKLYGDLSSGGMASSSDNGDTWMKYQTSMSGPFTNSLIRNGNYLYAANSNGGVYRSLDSALTWQTFDTDVSSWILNDLIGIGSTLFTSYGLYRSDDSAEHWRQIKLPYNISYLSTSKNFIFAAGDRWDTADMHVLSSGDKGNSFREITDNLQGSQLNLLAVSNDYLYAGTDSGLWRRPLAELGVPTEVTAGYSVGDLLAVQAYDNFSRNEIVFEFRVLKEMSIDIHIYDQLGRVIFTHGSQERLEFGKHQVAINSLSLPKGPLYGRIISNLGESQTVKLIHY